ncbi:MAG: hypothetical protein IJW46_01960 [Clostridia bacterium]|nr:hypothetical protein [Clostridia bacterium]
MVFAGFISLAFLFLGFLARNLIPIKYALILCGIVTLLSFIFLLTFPKQIEVTKTAVRIQHHTAFLKLLFVAIVSFCTKTRHTRDSELYISPCFTVFEIDYITYSHSKIEKFFHTGHIEVTGKYYSNLSDSFSECTFSVYGIKDFENTAAWMQSYIHLVE